MSFDQGHEFENGYRNYELRHGKWYTMCMFTLKVTPLFVTFSVLQTEAQIAEQRYRL